MAAPKTQLRLYGTHKLNKSGIHKYELFVTPSRGMKGLGSIGNGAFVLPINRFDDKARAALSNEFERFKQPGLTKNPAVRLGEITFQVIPTRMGKVAYPINYKPKGEIRDPIQAESRGTGLGGQIEALCLSHLEKSGKATHVSTTVGLRKYLEETEGYEKYAETLEAFSTSDVRIAHLKKCGIGARDILPINE